VSHEGLPHDLPPSRELIHPESPPAPARERRELIWGGGGGGGGGGWGGGCWGWWGGVWGWCVGGVRTYSVLQRRCLSKLHERVRQFVRTGSFPQARELAACRVSPRASAVNVKR